MARHRNLCGLICFLALSSVAAAARAQVPPFFGGGVVAFDPEVSVISSGALLAGQATVSADRKYVTITGTPTVSRLQSLQTFPVNSVVNVPLGFVGGISLPGGNAINSLATTSGTASGGGKVQLSTPSPDSIERSAKSWVFTRQGMYLLVPLSNR